jgi:hypothetical protein
MKSQAREKAIELRHQQWTYAEIAQKLNVSKGTLSLWLKDVPYSARLEVLERRRKASIRNGLVLKNLKSARVALVRSTAKDAIGQFTDVDFWRLGAMAYWAEGSKTVDSLVKFTNTDPDLVVMMVNWLRRICLVPPTKLRFHLRVHPGEDVRELERFWSELTGIPKSQFYRTTLKVSGSGGKTVRKLKHGIASVIVCDTELFYRIQGWIEAIKQEFGRSLERSSLIRPIVARP